MKRRNNIRFRNRRRQAAGAADPVALAEARWREAQEAEARAKDVRKAAKAALDAAKRGTR